MAGGRFSSKKPGGAPYAESIRERSGYLTPPNPTAVLVRRRTIARTRQSVIAAGIVTMFGCSASHRSELYGGGEQTHDVVAVRGTGGGSGGSKPVQQQGSGGFLETG